LSAVLIDFLFFPPIFTFTLNTSDAITLALFMAGCFLVIIGGQSVRLLVEMLTRAQAAQDTLYREMRHRTANNLHLIGTTIAIEATRAQSGETREVLRGIAGRIAAIGQVDQLIGAHGTADIDAGEHLRELCRFIGTSLVGRRPVTVTCEAETIALPRDATETIGIAINELVTNALKHAFAEAEVGHIWVRLAGDADGIAVTVEDDGRGCDRTAQGGIGWRLVESLIGKHGGTMAVESAEPGCRIRICLPRVRRTRGPSAPMSEPDVTALHQPQAGTRIG
jgi:two-component sensor histidine kinase